jgi:hypothetical protein
MDDGGSMVRFLLGFLLCTLELLSGGHGRRDELEHIEAW